MIESSGFFAGQVGALIRLDTQDDPELLAVATKKEIHYKTPSGSTGVWTASLDGTKLTYTTIDVADLPSPGTYLLQSYVEAPGWKAAGSIVEMVVEKPLISIE